MLIASFFIFLLFCFMPVGRKSRFPIRPSSNKNFAKRNRVSLLFAAFVLPSYHSSLPSGESFVPIGGATRDHHHHHQHHHRSTNTSSNCGLQPSARSWLSLRHLPHRIDPRSESVSRVESTHLPSGNEKLNTYSIWIPLDGQKRKRLIEETSFICLSG